VATEANTLPPSRATGVPPAARIDEERARLRPLKTARAELALRIPVCVSPTGVVIHEGHTYSMPPDALGCQGCCISIGIASASALSADFVTEGCTLIVTGKPGRGKTHLTIAVA